MTLGNDDFLSELQSNLHDEPNYKLATAINCSKNVVKHHLFVILIIIKFRLDGDYRFWCSDFITVGSQCQAKATVLLYFY